MYPHERSLVKKMEGKPFALIGVNSDQDRVKLKDALEENQITWRSFWNGPHGTQGPISRKWIVTGWPTLYVIDAKGVIRYKNPHHKGGYNEIDKAIEALLKEMGSS
jgi:hypothetical protein